MKALFWNLNGKPLENLVAQLVAEHNRDFVILSETTGLSATKLLVRLANACGTPFNYHAWEIQPRVWFLSRHSTTVVKPLRDSPGVSIRSVTFPGCQTIIVAGVHSSSRLYWSQPADRWAIAARIRANLELVEMQECHRRSVLVGDFNSDPFEDALTNSDALHAVSSRKIAIEGSRKVGGEERHFLYNPTWSLLGDAGPGPPGSYFYRGSTSVCRYWHLFDQVLLRPELARVFRSESLEVITKVGDISLESMSGTPDLEIGSDHFPIIFSLDLLQEFADVG